MYRIFALSELGWLYQLSSKGWVMRDGAAFTSVSECRFVLDSSFVPALPDGSIAVDAYIAAVDLKGLIITTFAFNATRADKEG